MKNIGHEYWMKRALSLAKRGQSWTRPNPLVGAVIVKDGKIIGEGYHRKFGDAHAEIDALNSVNTSNQKKIPGSTIYVTLEPCSHFGKTPPCADALIKAGIHEVYYASHDPNPLVSLRGIKKLEAAGIKTHFGPFTPEAQELNVAFMSFFEKKRPYVALKFAASLDGKIATWSGNSQWITNEKARKYTQRLRGKFHAILVGKNTVLKDNPNLGTHNKKLQDPLRIILDSTLEIPITSNVFRDKNVIMVTTSRAPAQRKNAYEQAQIELVIQNHDHIQIPELLKELQRKDIQSILVEGGSETLGSFLDAKLVDHVYVFHAPLLIGGKNALPAISGQGVESVEKALRLQEIKYHHFGDNLLTEGKIH